MGLLRIISRDKLDSILKKHKMWLNHEPGGEKADLSRAYLRDANLSGANLRGAYLSEANLNWVYLRRAYIRGADLRGADLSEVDLSEANLSEANLKGADLRGAYLRWADLSGANLSGANLRGSYLAKANLSEAKLDWPLVCPEKGSFVGYKKCRYNLIVKLEIPEDALRSSATTRKCRCSKVRVLSITNLDGSEVNVEYAVSKHNPLFLYKVGEVVSVDDFDTNRWSECSTGIHFFMTREEAVEYDY